MRQLHLTALKRPSAAQRQLLEDADKGALQPTRHGWRRPAGKRSHARNTADSLIKRRLLAYEYGFLIITTKGRAFLIAQGVVDAAA